MTTSLRSDPSTTPSPRTHGAPAAPAASAETTMRAVVQDLYGGPSEWRLDRLDRPQPASDEVLVRVRAAGLDRGVWHLMTGKPYLIRVLGFGFRGPKGRVPGLDLAGIVEAVGADVTRFRVGDEVFGACSKTYAEFACAKESELALKPASLGFEAASAVATSACTALRGLREVGRLEAGQRVLILGASGGVGSFAVQLAKHLGAVVTGVCSTSKLDLVRALGADHVRDYTCEDVLASGERYDLILDIGGNRSLGALRGALTPRGTLVIAGGEEGDRWIGGVDRQLRAMATSPFISQSLRTYIAEPRQEELELLANLFDTGALTVALDRTFPLAEAADAMRYLEAGHARGKVAITI